MPASSTWSEAVDAADADSDAAACSEESRASAVRAQRYGVALELNGDAPPPSGWPPQRAAG